MFSIHFKQKIINLFPNKGQDWLNSLSGTLFKLKQKWKLNSCKPLDNLSYNYVCGAYSNKYKAKVIIKIGCDTQEIFREVSALKFYNSNSCVKLIDYDANYNAILLEELKPGNSLKTLFLHQDELAAVHAANLIKRLTSNSLKDTANFPKIEHWLEGLASEKTDNKILNYHINKAKFLSSKLLNSAREPVFLHGDLHHDNILLSGNSWIAIDPKGVIGEADYEVGAFIRNPSKELIAHPAVKEIIYKRFEIFAKLLNLDEHRIREWCYVQAVVASCWAREDNILYQEFMGLAEIFQDILSKDLN